MTLNYNISGRGEALVLIHGFLGSSEDYQYLISELNKSYLVIAIDLPGFGNSKNYSLSQTLTYEFISLEILELLNKLSISSCNLFGYSLGGRITLNFASSYSGYVSKLILISANPGLELESDRIKRLKIDQEQVEFLNNNGLKEFLNRWYQNKIFNTLYENKKLRNLVIQKRLNNNDINWIKKVMLELSPGNVLSLWSKISSIKIPILWVYGSEDQKYLEIAKQVLQLNNLIKVLEISNVSHSIVEEKPEELLTNCVNFLKQKS